MSELIARRRRVHERIRKEELRPTSGPGGGPVPWRGARLTWNQGVGAIANPGVYAIPWSTEVTATDDVDWSAADRTHLFLNTPGLWAAQLYCEARIGADLATELMMAIRLLARLKLGGAELAAEVGAPFPVSDAVTPARSRVEVEMPPFLVSGRAVLTTELLPGYGVAGPTGTKLAAGFADLSVYLVTELA